MEIFKRRLQEGVQLQKGKSGDGAPKRRKYVYFDQLLFLTNILQKRETSCNYLAPLNDEGEEHQEGATEGTPTNIEAPTMPPKEGNPRQMFKQNYEEQLLDVLNTKAQENTDEEK